MSNANAADLAQNRITFEETPERLKVTIPVRRNFLNWTFLAIYTVLLVVWVSGFFYGTITYIRNVRASNAAGTFIFTLSVIFFSMMAIWLWFGRKYVWRWWQYHMANREILFINHEFLIVRRPVSILGLTDAYSMNHVSPLYWNDKYSCVAFDFGARGILFGTTLEQRDATWLIMRLNDRYFPNWRDEEDEDDAKMTLFD